LKDQFITGISHELRTPLTAIKGYSELLMMTSQNNLDERRLEFVRTIGENASQLLHHINELIDISQIHAGTLGLDKSGCVSQNWWGRSSRVGGSGWRPRAFRCGPGCRGAACGSTAIVVAWFGRSITC